MSTAGKMGSIEKAVMVDGTTGTKTLIVRANMPAGAINQWPEALTRTA